MTFSLHADGLRKSFGGLLVTDNVSLQLEPGARHALIGPNGAGKTTLVGLLSGVLVPDAGRILLAGHDVSKTDARTRVKRGLVRTFQVNSLFNNLTVLQNVLLAVSEHRSASTRMFGAIATRADLVDRAEAMIEQVGLSAEAHRTIVELPYGPQRLVEIAIALSLEPKVLLLDEPTAGIPAADASYLLEAIERMPADIAILMIEHDMHVVRQFARAVTVLVAGAVLCSGPPDEIMASDEVRRVYLGQGGQLRYATGDTDA
ncbi:MAG: ABC transporter ATP-binding protein [Burkholderiales bacterium]